MDDGTIPLAEEQGAVLDRRLHRLPLRLGFGTAWLPNDGAAATRLVRCAVDCGIRYFDTARMYGSGLAEGRLGAALHDLPAILRDEIVVTTKLGILPQSEALHARIARRAARSLRRPAPRFAQPRFGCFAPDAMVTSLETSLRELRVEHVDILLLHEVAPEDLTDEALRQIEDLVHAGKADRVGLATGLPQTVAILAEAGAPFDVVQIADDAWQKNAGRLGAGSHLLVTHSLLVNRFRHLRNQIGADAELRRAWSRELDFDADEPGALARLFLRYALAANHDGIVLFSTTSTEHLRGNVRSADEGPLEPAKMHRLEALIA